jgi:hypothetical protein
VVGVEMLLVVPAVIVLGIAGTLLHCTDHGAWEGMPISSGRTGGKSAGFETLVRTRRRSSSSELLSGAFRGEVVCRRMHSSAPVGESRSDKPMTRRIVANLVTPRNQALEKSRRVYAARVGSGAGAGRRRARK